MSGPTSLDLRNLAAAMDRQESAANFVPARMPPRDLRIEWSDGSSCPGYKELTAAMAFVVARRFEELRDEALDDLACDVEDRRKKALGA